MPIGEQKNDHLSPLLTVVIVQYVEQALRQLVTLTNLEKMILNSLTMYPEDFCEFKWNLTWIRLNFGTDRLLWPRKEGHILLHYQACTPQRQSKWTKLGLYNRIHYRVWMQGHTTAGFCCYYPQFEIIKQWTLFTWFVNNHCSEWYNAVDKCWIQAICGTRLLALYIYTRQFFWKVLECSRKKILESPTNFSLTR